MSDRSHFFPASRERLELKRLWGESFPGRSSLCFVYAFSEYVQEPMVLVEVECIPEDIERVCNRLSNDFLFVKVLKAA